MSNPYKFTRSEMVSWLPNLRDVLDDNLVVPVLVGVQDTLAIAVGDAFDELAAATASLVVAEAEYHAAVSLAESAMTNALEVAQSVKYQMKASSCSGSVFLLAGFDAPVEDPVAYIPVAPIELSAFGYSNGVNKLEWLGNNTGGAVNFIVEALIDDSLTWVIVGSTKRQRYSHTPVQPGIRYEYRVFARAASGDSDNSGSAVVYG